MTKFEAGRVYPIISFGSRVVSGLYIKVLRVGKVMVTYQYCDETGKENEMQDKPYRAKPWAVCEVEHIDIPAGLVPDSASAKMAL